MSDTSIRVIPGVSVPMRDGVELVADLYLPPTDGPFPLVIERTPYDKALDRNVGFAQFMARRGIASLLQDVRGRGDSGGRFHHLLNHPDEGSDGFDTIAWAGRQTWCDGSIATNGGSFSAANQQAAALMHPPGLVAQVLQDAGTDYYRRMFRYHGAFNLGALLPWVVTYGVSGGPGARRQPDALSAMQRELGPWLDRLPLRRGESPFALVPEYEDFYLSVLERGDDTAYWDNPATRLAGRWDDYPRDVAVLLLSGWYAFHTAANLEKFSELTSRLSRPVQLIVGPWVHFPMIDTCVVGDVDFGRSAAAFAPDMDVRWRWFQRYAAERHVDPPVHEAPLHLFRMGEGDGHRTQQGRLFHGGQWRTAREWPLPETHFTEFFLHPHGQLAASPPADDASPSRYDFDPRDPYPSIGGNNLGPSPELLPSGPQDQRCRPWIHACKGSDRPLSERSDVLAFDTPPLISDVEVTGPISTQIWVASSAFDTDFVARLADVYPASGDYPNGYALLIAEGIMRMRYRDDRPVAELIEPGRVYKIAIELQPTSNVFKRGHRIRLYLASAAFPQYDVNPNTGEPLGRETRTEVAHQVVFHERARPSHIVLPLIR